MNLDEAIKHCEEKACDNTECAAEHRQLAEWLNELKELKSDTLPKLKDGIGMTRLGFTHEQIQAIERYVRRYIDYTLRPQKQWKPSDEQIKAVKEAACYSSVFSEKTIDNLILLSKQLKKLREE